FTFFNTTTKIKFDVKRRRKARAGANVGKHSTYFPKIDAALLDHYGYLPSSAVIHRDVFAHVGFFDETIDYSEDVEFFMRAASRCPLTIVHKRLVYYCRHGENMTNNSKEMEEFLRLITEKMVRCPDNYAEGAGQFYLDRLKKLFVGKA